MTRKLTEMENKLIDKLKAIYDRPQEAFSVLECLVSDEEREAVIDFIETDDDVTPVTVMYVAINIEDERNEREGKLQQQ